MPACELERLEGGVVRADQAFAGRVALVAFWATWCDTCVRELEVLGRLSAEARSRGALVVAVAVGESRQRVGRFLSAMSGGVAHFIDPEFQLADALEERRVPATVVVDETGRVRFSGGALDPEALRAFERTISDRLP